MAATVKGLGKIIKLSVSQNGQGFSPSWYNSLDICYAFSGTEQSLKICLQVSKFILSHFIYVYYETFHAFFTQLKL